MNTGTFADNGNSDPIAWSGTRQEARRGYFSVCGTWGGGTVVLQYLGPDGSTYVTMQDGDFANVSLTADGSFEFVSDAATLRVTLSGATAPDLSWRVSEVKDRTTS